MAIFTLFSFCNISLRDQKLYSGPKEYQVCNIKACKTVSTVRKESIPTDKYTIHHDITWNHSINLDFVETLQHQKIRREKLKVGGYLNNPPPRS